MILPRGVRCPASSVVDTDGDGKPDLLVADASTNNSDPCEEERLSVRMSE